MAKGYILVTIDIPDKAAYAASGYMQLAERAIADHGGTYLIRGGEPETLEGPQSDQRVVMLEFQSRAAAKAFYQSNQYAPAIELRQSLSTGRMLLLSGLD